LQLTKQSKRRLICALNCGVGHASRCIAIIRLLIEKNAEIIIASEGRPLQILKNEFPQLTFIEFKGYDIEYPKSGSMAWKMLLSLPNILKRIKEEHLELEKIVEQYKIDIVISDNRYGCYSNKVTSVFITHQLMVKAPIGEKIVHNKICSYIKKYDECWIPDYKNENNLSADLSHYYPLPKNSFFIGPLSRFENTNSSNNNFTYDIMAIVSGPEPQRTIFENLLSKELYASKLHTIILCGTPDRQIEPTSDTFIKIAHANSNQMQSYILQSKIIITRSGYSTIMDLAALSKKAIFIPTPGQTEQEYLAKYFMNKKIAYSQKQSAFNLEEALDKTKNYTGFTNYSINNNLLKERINLLLS